MKTPLILPFQCWCCGAGTPLANMLCFECEAVYVALQAPLQSREPVEMAAAL